MSAGGRGRGRGRPSRNTHILQETGVGGSDGTTLLYQITHPPLYPDLLWHSSGRPRSASFQESEFGGVAVKTELDAVASGAGAALQTIKRSAIVTYTLAKQEEIIHTLQVQQHQLDQVATTNDKSKRQKVLADLLGPKLATDTRYYPAELLFNSTMTKKKKKSTVALRQHHGPDRPVSLEQLDELEQKEGGAVDDAAPDVVTSNTTTDNAKTGDAEENEEDDEFDEQDIGPEENEEELDYMQNYYASEGESDGDGGDGEAVF